MTKADETFQESVQALANWLTFLEGKLNYYTRQLERARAHQSQGEQPVEVETPPVAPVEETKKAEDGTWMRVDTVKTVAEEDALDDVMDTWGKVDDDAVLLDDGESLAEIGGNGKAAISDLPDDEMDTWGNVDDDAVLLGDGESLAEIGGNGKAAISDLPDDEMDNWEEIEDAAEPDVTGEREEELDPWL